MYLKENEFVTITLTQMGQITKWKNKLSFVPELNKPFDVKRVHETSIEDIDKNICVDLDGVLHGYSKGFYDGSMYDIPKPGSKEAIDELKKYFNIVIFTARVSPTAHGKEGAKEQRENIKKWLKKYNIYYDKITCEKIPASFYIDDRAIRFSNWEKTLQLVSKLKKD
jgi:hypothetical protein